MTSKLKYKQHESPAELLDVQGGVYGASLRNTGWKIKSSVPSGKTQMKRPLSHFFRFLREFPEDSEGKGAAGACVRALGRMVTTWNGWSSPAVSLKTEGRRGAKGIDVDNS